MFKFRPPKSSKIETIGNTKGVFKFDAKITYCIVRLAVTERKLSRIRSFYMSKPPWCA